MAGAAAAVSYPLCPGAPNHMMTMTFLSLSGAGRGLKLAYQKMSVLLVDSITTCVDTLQSHLKDFEFYRVWTTSSAEEAIGLCREKELNLLITGWKMQPLSGLQLLEAVRKDPRTRSLPVLVLREKRDTYIEDKARPLGVAGFLDLPLDYNSVRQAVEQVLERFVDPAEEEFDQHMNTARLALRKERLDQAAAAFEKALAVRDDHDALLGLGRVLLQQGDAAEAERKFMAALRLNPDSLGAYLALADLYAKAESYREAVKVLSAGVKAAGRLKSDGATRASLLYQIGEFKLRLKELKAALGFFQEAVEAMPQDPELRAKIGDALSSEGHHGEAEPFYQAAMEMDPDKVHYFNRLGIAYRRQGKFEKALELYQRVQAQRNEDENLQYNMARCYYDMKQDKEAARHLVRAMKLNPDFPEAKKLLDVVLARMGYGAKPQ